MGRGNKRLFGVSGLNVQDGRRVNIEYDLGYGFPVLVLGKLPVPGRPTICIQ